VLRDTEGTQDLASGFGGGAGIAGTTRTVGADLARMVSKAPPLYSAVEEAVANAKSPQAPAQQWLGMIRNTPGVKPEEVEHLGVEDFLKGQKGPVSKQALQEHIAGNKVNVQEVMLGDVAGGKDTLDSVAERLYGRSYDELGTAREQRAVQQELFNSDARPTKFQQYTLPGGENYRELLLTLPEKTPPPTTRSGKVMPQEGGGWKVQWDDGTFSGGYGNRGCNTGNAGQAVYAYQES
jgi:hypothetical protein